MTKRGEPTAVVVARPKRLIAKAFTAGVVLAGSTALALDHLPDREVRAFERIHQVPRWFDYVLWLPMQMGSAWAPLVTAIVAHFTIRSWRPTVGVLVVGWGGWWLARIVKVQVGRGRPYEEIGPDGVRDTAITDGLGFVSGHATVAFACAAVLGPYVSRSWRIAIYAIAALTALSRVVVGAHLPLDVMGGASLGLLLGWLWHLVAGIDVSKARR